MRDLSKIPEGLPVPTDDGACDHLKGVLLPGVTLQTTSGRTVNLRDVRGRTVFFFYPRTGEPSKPAPPDWDLIPGARGCTPQSCGFRDLYQEFRILGFEIYGVSSQDSSYQKEFVIRNHIPFEILSDSEFRLTDSLRVPTFQYNGMRLIKRMAWITEEGSISKVFYPVFPPNENATQVLKWLKTR
jgi:peroxiredoxin